MRYEAKVRSCQSIEDFARIHYEAQMKYIFAEALPYSKDLVMLPWAKCSGKHRKLERVGIRAVLDALDNKAKEYQMKKQKKLEAMVDTVMAAKPRPMKQAAKMMKPKKMMKPRT